MIPEYVQKILDEMRPDPECEKCSGTGWLPEYYDPVGEKGDIKLCECCEKQVEQLITQQKVEVAINKSIQNLRPS